MRQDLHVHTTWSDGKATPREMIERALELGLERVAITDHSYFEADEGYCLPRDTSRYVADIRMLAQEYAGRIEVLCGIEQDFHSPALGPMREADEAAQRHSDDMPQGRACSLCGEAGDGARRDVFDWIVGSVHYVRFDDAFISIDDTPALFERAAVEYCAGDYLALAERYFDTVADVVGRTGATLIGHFDLVKKFNERGRYFDETSPRYRAAWKKAADALLETGVPFEVNTGGMFRGWRTDEYPSRDIQEYLRSRGATLIHTSDAHAPEALYYGCQGQR